MKEQIQQHLDAHAKQIDELHKKLDAAVGVDKEKLQKAVDKFKAAHKQFRDDALACMN
ncbi:MAG TPA: hypothetical protein VKF82_03480 [Candidatus Eremiobacteraceae bacterium]|nr:hypothetical protein [Candidatus Eremiobacteraceae bacterium]